MPRSYPAEFRRTVLDLIEAGRPVAEIADQLGVTGQTIYNWCNQDLVDRGLRPGSRFPTSWRLTFRPDAAPNGSLVSRLGPGHAAAGRLASQSSMT